MKTAHGRRASSLALLVSALALTAIASHASAQGTTQIASTPAEHAWWPTKGEHVRSAPLALQVRDDHKLASWYIEHLGFKAAGLPGAVRGGGAQTRATTIYHDGVVLQLQANKSKGPQQIVVAVRDLDAQLRALEKAGIPLTAQGTHSAQLRDPEGNLIELVDDGSHPRTLARNR